ncbi:MAG: type IX secretion system sortase PorU [Cruoricaptor ignavus]|nr:type IX secretion system sortase PorU [Cruoricaptor ignavus]
MKNIVLLSAFVLATPFCYSQKVSIVWEGSQTVDYGIEKRAYPKFSHPGYTADGNSVYINQNVKSDGKKVKIENMVWQKTTEKDLYGLTPELLPNYDNTSVGYFYNSTENAEYYNINISALKYDKGQIYKLVSFDIVPDNASVSAKTGRFTSKLGNTENPLKSGTFYKIKVDKSGVYKITKKFLTDNGINVNNINPKNFRIYGNGGLALSEYNQDEKYAALQENAIQVVGEEDGVWNDEDYVLFYAQGPNGFNLYNSGYNAPSRNTRTDTRNDRSLHFTNIYEDNSYYFINFDLGEGKRVENEDTNLPSELITRYDDYQFINEDKTNLLKLGRIWVSDPITRDINITLNTRSPIRQDDVVRYRTSVVGYKSQNNSIKQSINGQNEYTQTITSSNDFIKTTNFNGTISNLSGNQITFNISPNFSGNPNGSFFFDYVEVLYKEDLAYNDAQMNFRSYDIYEGRNETYGFSVSNAGTAEQVWDVSDITNAKRKVNKSGNNSTFNFGYTASSEDFNNEFVAFKNTSAYTPSFVGRIENQDLSSLQNIDYLAITRKDMLGEAQRLANYHESVSGFRTAVVDVEKIYNEFSSGGKDITAIRDFITKLKNENGGLKYVFILGDTSYDYKDKTISNDNVMPSYQSEDSSNYISTFVTDDYFVMTAPQTVTTLSGQMPTTPIGRLPASNTTEAKLLIDKTLAYYNALPGQSSPFGEWRMKLNFVVDDDMEGGGPFHNVMNDAIVHNFESGTERKEYNIRKLYLDAFKAEASAGGQRFPQINQAISNDMGNSLYMFYFGHGGIHGWAQERVLTFDEIQNFNNYTAVYSRFPLVSTITCEFTLWDEPEVSSTGEQVIKHKTGGAATMITSSRAIGVPYGRQFTDILTKHLFALQNNDFKRLGDAHLSAKIEKGRDSNHLKVNFLGDPAMKMSRPKPLLTIENIETPVAGKIQALDFVKITGKVTKEDGTVDTNFNGRVAVNIFDKRLNKTTLNNDNSSGMLPLLNFTEEGSAIVKSSGKAVNGEYVVEFYVPKDINYENGEGRILMYADNYETAKANAYDVFANQPYTIGSINENGINDNEAPKVNLYMNNTNFADGGITDQNPTFLACITDNTGINSTGSGVGHDITVILDGQVINTIVLNDFYSSGESNGCINSNLAEYQKGSVTYPFRNLTPGTHQLTFKVWDINNNSTTSTLNFVVKDESEEKLVLNKLLNWPNPFTNKTYIQFEHNCDDILDVNVQIYTITGKLVKTISVPVSSEPFMQGYRTPRQTIEWDGTDDYGDTVGKGTYIYKVFAKSQNQDKCKGGATAVEKMVILK